ncbi:hypothetical protein [Bacillus seohaeanensis]|jgi:hypothetical protein|uniref:NAD(P)-dependent oxidoreductase n=1 Tax=Bacillus seohaeanensis TaxID=284580 RepID=A0ABW5RS38_9BACI
MNHAVVLAAQQFLGFELCSVLLEKGWSVTAIDDSPSTGDKWMGIGRNSNVEYNSYLEWDKKIAEESIIFIPYYDLLGKGDISCLEKMTDQLKKGNYSNSSVVQLFPTVPILIGKKDMSVNSSRNVTTIYLPTLYGPHQPSAFLYSQVLKNKVDNMEKVQYVDDESSAIYIKDAANIIVEKSTTHKTYQLESEGENSWEEALSLLTSNTIPTKSKELTKKGIKLTIKSSLSPKEILQEQKRWSELAEME